VALFDSCLRRQIRKVCHRDTRRAPALQNHLTNNSHSNELMVLELRAAALSQA